MKTNLPPAQLKSFQKRLLRWFRAHKRDLPWRASRDPYRVWVAEVMLQQTRIAAVMLDDLFRGAVQIACSAVISEAGPQL